MQFHLWNHFVLFRNSCQVSFLVNLVNSKNEENIWIMTFLDPLHVRRFEFAYKWKRLNEIKMGKGQKKNKQMQQYEIYLP